jgi:RNA polymerase sigma-70 factor (ECF subfamily)
VFEKTATDAGQAQIDFEALERHARLFRLVEALAEDQRRVVLMRFVEEKSIREISQTLQRSEGAIKQLQFRALQNLRKEIIPEDTKKRSAES